VRVGLDMRFLALAAMLLSATACGVKQNNSRIRRSNPTESRLFAAFGPFYSGTNDGNNLTTNPATCGSATRPCLKMRASVGLPYQFDTNTNSQQGPLVVGTSFPAAPNAYNTQISGPGKVKPTVSVRSDQPQLENKDLKLMKRQTASGDYSF
jgi:hypothetical protein